MNPQIDAAAVKRATLTFTLPGMGAFSLPISNLLWGVCGLLTYPLRLTAGYFLFGWRGALLVALMLLLAPRWK